MDYKATTWLNGHEEGNNTGGHVPFSFDIAPYLVNGVNRLVVRAEVKQDGYQPQGKLAVGGQPVSLSRRVTVCSLTTARQRSRRSALRRSTTVC